MSPKAVARVALWIILAATVTLPVIAADASKDKAAAKWTPPKTADGVPDISGVFSNASTVPLERDKALGAKEFYTEEEYKAQLARAAARVANQAEPGGVGDVHYDMTQFALDRGHTKVSANMRTSIITGPEGRVPPSLPEATKRAADRQAANRGHTFDSYEYRGLSERCYLWGNEGPPILPQGYNSNLQIFQGPGYVGIDIEMIHDVRIIPTDGRPHLPSNIRQWFGDSRGHWEGNTLVVDTTNFTDRTQFRGSTDTLHVIERFTRTDADTVLYQFTVSDPKTWEKSWTGEVPLLKTTDKVYEYACHEGNLGLPNILSGARAEEKRLEEAKKGK